MFAAATRLSFFICAIFTFTIAANAVSQPDPALPKPYFEQNLGQTSSSVKFLQRGPNYTLFLTSTGAVLKMQRKTSSGTAPLAINEGVVRMTWQHAKPESIYGKQLQEGQVNYLSRNNKSRDITAIPIFEEVIYKNLYPGIDLIHYSVEGELEHDLRVAPGADPSVITYILKEQTLLR
jgi:hypothetical protein